MIVIETEIEKNGFHGEQAELFLILKVTETEGEDAAVGAVAVVGVAVDVVVQEEEDVK